MAMLELVLGATLAQSSSLLDPVDATFSVGVHASSNDNINLEDFLDKISHVAYVHLDLHAHNGINISSAGPTDLLDDDGNVRVVLDDDGVPPITDPHFAHSSPKANQTPNSFANLFKEAANIHRTGKLRFIPPIFTEIGTRHALIPDDLIAKQSEQWLMTLVGSFVGKRSVFPFVRFHAFRLWKKYGLVDVVLNNQGRFYFKFDNAEGMDFVIKNRPWLFNDIPVLLKKWEVGIENDKIRPTYVHMWVNIYDLDATMWDYDILSHITSVISCPVALDRFTEEMIEKKSGRALFARVLIEVSADHDIPAFVEALVLGKMQKFLEAG
uniref:uncharacterized protein LOC122583345 n=1 Tax=Erigeron canadensis TaxID=72917 RepID=UPI001CB93E9D|nr:uncharacterized protein LOC122583345 [Erigeron canadensis]